MEVPNISFINAKQKAQIAVNSQEQAESLENIMTFIYTSKSEEGS